MFVKVITLSVAEFGSEASKEAIKVKRVPKSGALMS